MEAPMPDLDAASSEIAAEPALKGEFRQPVVAGRARRYEGFEATIALAEQCGGCPLTKFELQAAVRYCPELSRTEAVLLGEYIDVIDHDRIATGEAFGYIAMDLLAARTGLNPRTIRSARAALERKKLALRHYTNANHPAPYHGFDLRPFLAQAPALLAARDAAVDAAYGNRERNGAIYQESFDTGGEAISRRHIQSPSYYSGKSVRNTESALSADTVEQRRTDSSGNKSSNVNTEICSPRGASGDFGSSSSTEDRAETVRVALTEAHRYSATLASCISQPEIDQLDLAALYGAIETTLPRLLPERNTVETWQWAVRRHGWRAIVMLAVSLDDPSVRDPYRFFGGLATGKIDVRDRFQSNFQRMARVREAAMIADDAAKRPVTPAPSVSAARLGAVIHRLTMSDPAGQLKWFREAQARGCPAPATALTQPTSWAAWITDAYIQAEMPRFEEGD